MDPIQFPTRRHRNIRMDEEYDPFVGPFEDDPQQAPPKTTATEPTLREATEAQLERRKSLAQFIAEHRNAQKKVARRADQDHL